MNKKDWLDAATKKIYFRPDRKAVRRELEAHFEDLREASGLEAEAAAAAMGDPEAIAEELGRLHRPWLGYLWRLSQLMLLGAAAVYCLLLVLLVWRGRADLLPGHQLCRYLQADAGTMAALYEGPALEERALRTGTVLKTGGYTICNDRALCRRVKEGEDWHLYIDLDVTSSRWEEPLDCWNAVSGFRTDVGRVEKGSCSLVSVNWGFWQKCAFELWDFPEDAAWVELDLGFGELKRTLHIDLTEEAEP